MLYLFLLFSLILTGCEQKVQERRYTEVLVPAAPVSMRQGPAVSTANAEMAGKLAWQVPQGWSQEPASLMRLATLRLISRPEAFDCSIVSLPGNAGGIEANLRRWMEQIGLKVSDEEMARFMGSSGDGIFDFGLLQKAAGPDAESIIAAALELEGTMIFVKLKGSMSVIRENKDAFLSLVKSIHLK